MINDIEPGAIVIAVDEHATLQTIRRDIEAHIQELVDDGGEDFAASLLAEWRKQVDVLKRIAPLDHELRLTP